MLFENRRRENVCANLLDHAAEVGFVSARQIVRVQIIVVTHRNAVKVDVQGDLVLLHPAFFDVEIAEDFHAAPKGDGDVVIHGQRDKLACHGKKSAHRKCDRPTVAHAKTIHRLVPAVIAPDQNALILAVVFVTNDVLVIVCDPAPLGVFGIGAEGGVLHFVSKAGQRRGQGSCGGAFPAGKDIAPCVRLNVQGGVIVGRIFLRDGACSHKRKRGDQQRKDQQKQKELFHLSTSTSVSTSETTRKINGRMIKEYARDFLS